ncbi:hypothetical protein Tco_1198159 [Tanacetum coccineum]
MNKKETSIMELHSLLQTVEQGIKKIDVPSTSASHVLTVGHNAKKRKTSHSNWKGKATKGKPDRGTSKMEKSKRVVTQGLKESRRLKYRELNLVMGNMKIMSMTRIRKYELMLKSGDGYKFSFNNENGDSLVYSNGCFMFKASLCKGSCERGEGLLDLVHTDVCGPFRSATEDGKRYYVTLLMISVDMDMLI